MLKDSESVKRVEVAIVGGADHVVLRAVRHSQLVSARAEEDGSL
jgi:hypothetical protein